MSIGESNEAIKSLKVSMGIGPIEWRELSLFGQLVAYGE